MHNKNNNENKGLKKGVIPVAIGGIFVMVFMPFFAVYFSININNLLDLPDMVIFPFNIVVSVIILGTGLFWGVWANISLVKIGKGSPMPSKTTQTKNLVIKGPYKYSRNPVYFGYILFLIGLGVLFNALFFIMVFVPLYTILLLLFVRSLEEKDLTERFGESYLIYKKKVSFIIPFPPKK